MKYEPEVTFIDRDGKRYPAKITGHGIDGLLPQEFIGTRVKLDGKECLETLATDYNGDTKKVQVKELKSIECGSAVNHLNGKSEPIMRPALDLLVNFGNNKKGEIWNLVPSVSRKEHLTFGPNVMPKPYYEPLAPSKLKSEK